MNKTWLIIKREYWTRVRKKSFIIMTLLGPVLMAGMLMLTVWLGVSENANQKVLVIDETQAIYNKLKNTQYVKFDFIDTSFTLAQAKNIFQPSDYTCILHIPEKVWKTKAGNLFFKKQPSAATQRAIENRVETVIENYLLDDLHINREDFYRVKTNFNLHLIKSRKSGEEEEVFSEVAGVGFFFAIIIYMFIFMYGVQVMRGVIEEKTGRIIEVIISSVKPIQLMMGKIIGVAMVGLTQFLMWIILTGLISGIAFLFLSTQYDPATITDNVQMSPEVMQQLQQESVSPQINLNDPNMLLNRINFPLMLGMFLFYFLGGYLLYSALFAAVGAAVDSETDTQQFMLPITLPLIFAYMMSFFIVLNPEGPASFWLSIIPLTSPVVMMVRIAIGFEAGDLWQLYLSMSLLVAGFLAAAWIAARIYRTGILMYGKKPSYRELWKWLTYKG